MRKFFATLLYFYIFLYSTNAEMYTPISVNDLSRMLDFSGKIIEHNKTNEVVTKHGDAIISAILFEPEDNGFSRIQVLTTHTGFLWNDAMRERVEKASSSFRKLDLPDGSIGYVGFEGGGPGGESYIAVASIPQKKIDVQIKIIINNESNSPDNSGDFSSYHTILRDNQKLQKLLESLLTHSVNSLPAYQVKLAELKPIPLDIIDSRKQNQFIDNIDVKKDESVANNVNDAQDSTNNKWLWLIGFVLILFLILAIILKNKI